MKTRVNYFVAIVLFFSTFQAFSGIVPVQRMEMKTIPGSTTVDVGDLSQIQLGLAGTGQIDLFRKGVITFGVDHSFEQSFAPYIVEIKIRLKTYALQSDPASAFVSSSDETLKLYYHPNGELNFADKKNLEFDLTGLEKYSVELISIDMVDDIGTVLSSPTILPGNLFIYLDLFANRVNDFTNAVSTNMSPIAQEVFINSDLIPDELEVSWQAVPGAEEYQLEWTYINDYDPSSTNTTPSYLQPQDANQLQIDFAHNSTRISTTNASYNISLNFDHGYLCYRVRAIGRSIAPPYDFLYTNWTSESVDELVNMDSYAIETPFEVNKNWQYSATYAEEGKKKEVISFFDGSLRNRQMVTRINTDGNVIVGETLYDHQGRPAIQVLPTPVDGGASNALMFYENYSMVNPTQEFEKSIFDVSAPGVCDIESTPMDSDFGASNYYSPQNPNINNEQGFVPNAEEFPYSQVEYTPDNTGRIRRQGGVGEDFQLSSDHETQYFYGHPFQEQLNDLFGSEAGDASHYQKNMVIDANGQTSISYLDQEGRVIATSLAGIPPSQLMALPKASTPEQINVDLFATSAENTSSSNVQNSAGDAIVFSQTILLSSQSAIGLNYDFTIDPYENVCIEDICFGCVYDLKIEITDECGNYVPVPNEDSNLPDGIALIEGTVGQFELDNETVKFIGINCESDEIEGGTQQLLTDVLPAGNYFIRKTLTINQDALDDYTELFINNSTCLPSYEELLTEGQNANTINCDPDVDCQACLDDLGSMEDYILGGFGTQSDYLEEVALCNNLCETDRYVSTMRETLMSDMRPNGQYASYLSSTGNYEPQNFPLSIFNSNCLLPIPFTYNNFLPVWKNPRLQINNTELNEYWNEELTERTRIQVINNAGSWSPPVSNIALIFEDPLDNSFYTYPENLQNVQDFINAYNNNSGWARSLIVYHPEFPIFKSIEFSDKLNNGATTSSEDFDVLMQQSGTWANGSSLINLNPNDPLNPYYAPTDPFNTQQAVFGIPAGVFQNRLDNFATINGNSYSIYEFAAIATRCGQSSFGQNSLPPSCDDFGQGLDETIKDQEWLLFRSMYIQLKRELMLKYALERSLNDPAYFGYNGCIENTDFDPFENGFTNYNFNPFNLNLTSNSFQPLQPCNFATYDFYANKAKRFINPMDDYNEDVVNYVAYQQYLLTGQCPVASALENFLREAASGQNGGTNYLSSTTFSANDIPSFSSLLFAMNDLSVPSTIPSVTWNITTMTSSEMSVILNDPFGQFGVLNFIVPSEYQPLDWNTIISFSAIQYLYTSSVTGEHFFKITAKIEVGGVQTLITLNGKTDLPIGSCNFDEVCDANQLGKDIRGLMNALAAGNLLNLNPATPQNLMAIPAPPEMLSSLVTQPILVAAQYTSASFFEYHGYVSYLTAFKFKATGSKNLLLRVIDNPNNVASTLATTTNISISDILSETEFILSFKNAAGVELGLFTCELVLENNGNETQYMIAECDLPQPALCTGVPYETTANLKKLLDDVFAIQNVPFDLLATVVMEDALLSQFTYTGSSITNTPSSFLNGIESISFPINEGCPLVLNLSNTDYPNLTFNQITGITEISSFGVENSTGSYNDFQLLVTTSNPNFPTAVLTGFSCLNLKFCTECEENPTQSISARLFGENKLLYVNEDKSVEQYLIYKKLLNEMNARHGWTIDSTNYVHPFPFADFFRDGISKSSDQFFEFIKNYRYEIDTYGYISNPSEFINFYGVDKNARKEYERYVSFMNKFNTGRQSNGLSTVSVHSIQTFLTAKYIDSLDVYFKHLLDYETYNGQLKMFINFPSLNNTQNETDSCNILYHLYVAAYHSFEVYQAQHHNCPHYQELFPMYTIEVFIKNNLCCSANGYQAFQDYINSFYVGGTVPCPDELPYVKECDTSNAVVVDERLCNKYWVSYKTLVGLYNQSPHAAANHQSISFDYPIFAEFLDEGLCDCILEYLMYLNSYINMTPSEAANNNDVVMSIDEYCSKEEPPYECREIYHQYITCIGEYNQWAIGQSWQQSPPLDQIMVINDIITEQTFYDFELCDCVDAYCDALNQLITDDVMPESLPDIFSLCYGAPPCSPESPWVGDATPPTLPMPNPCAEFVESNLEGNAWNSYNIALQQSITEFQNEYRAHCIGAIEQFRMTCDQVENHFTLYYYDQAGNLIKTVPPEGVEFTGALTNVTKHQAINTDRLNGTHTELTKHRLATHYLYNSLNQLIAQGMPDQDKLDIFDVTLPNGLVAGLNTTAIQMVNENLGYLSGFVNVGTNIAVNNKRGYLYKTTNGGTNWQLVNNVVGADLKEVEWIPGVAATAYAIGESGVLLRTVNNGAHWDVVNTFDLSSPIVANFVALEVVQESGAYVVYAATKDGMIYKKDASNSTFLELFANQIVPPANTTLVRLKDFEMIQNERPSVIVTLSDVGGEFDAILEFDAIWKNPGTNTPTLFTASLIDAENAVIGGVDGDFYTLTNNVAPVFGDFALQRETSSFLGNIEKVFALNTERQVIQVNDGGAKSLHYTFDGGSTWTLIDMAPDNLNISIVSRSASEMDLVATSTSEIKRFHVETTGDFVEYSQMLIGNNPSSQEFISISSLVNNGAVRYFGLKANGQVYATAPHNYGYTGLTFTLYGSTTLSNPQEIQCINYTGTNFAVFVRGSANSNLRVSAFSNFQSLTGTFASTSFASQSVSDLDVFRIGSNELLAVYNNALNKVGSCGYNALLINYDSEIYASGSTSISTYENTVLVLGANGTVQHKSIGFIGYTPSTMESVAISRFKTGLNDIHENTGNVVYTGDNGTVIYRDLSTTTANHQIRPVGVIDHLYTSERNLTNVFVAGDKGTFLSIEDNTWLASPVLMNSGMAANELFPTVCFTAMDVKSVTGGNAIYVVGTKGTALYSPNASTTMFGGLSNISSEHFKGVKWKQNEDLAYVVGTNASIFTFSTLFGTRCNNVHPAALNDVHFANANMGTIVGEHFTLRTSINGGIGWKVNYDPALNTAQSNSLKKTWTIPRPDGKHFALFGGNNVLNKISDGLVSYYSVQVSSATVSDIQFHKTTPTIGYCSTEAGTLKRMSVVPAGNDYNVTFSPAMSMGLTTCNAIHVFENGSVVGVGTNQASFVNSTDNWLTSTNVNPNTASGTPAIVGVLRDVYFHDDLSGYFVGDDGVFYLVKNQATALNPSYFITSKTINDPIIDNSEQFNVRCIAFATRYDGIYGGSYASPFSSAMNSSSFLRKVHHEESQFAARFFYDRLGRLIVSQNSRQMAATPAKFSYTLYDALGRVYEVGEKTENTGSNIPLFKTIFGTYVGQNLVPTVIDDDKLAFWLLNPSGARKEVTRSYYDETDDDILAQLPANFNPDVRTQRKRIVHVSYEETYDNNDATYDHATHYDYDIHGNVVTLLQDNRSFSVLPDLGQHRFKRMDYIFDLVSGNVHRMSYQTGNADQWHHAYTYDGDNRIQNVYTTNTTPMLYASDGMASVMNEVNLSTYWDRDANYHYYDHGPLAKTTLGNENVQGTDYAYTLQGWLKGINSNSLVAAYDIGKDGFIGGQGAKIARDVASFSLHYFEGDYSSINGVNGFIADVPAGDMLSNTYNLYNGNIGRMITTITNPNSRDILALGNVYRYDQLQRLKRSESFTGLDIGNNSWITQTGDKYVNTFDFDANGNIEYQARFGATGNLIDALQYRYNEDVNGNKTQNRLYHLTDYSTSNAPDELTDMGAFTSGGAINNSNNYRYDQEGRLVKDIQEEIEEIVWRVDGKVKKIIRPLSSTEKTVSFDYDAMGNRIAKHILSANNYLEKSTFYVLDAQGNTISTYERTINDANQTITFEQSEKHIYGSSRLGVMNTKIPMLGSQNSTYSQATWTHTIGEKTFEISNHLGNVLAVISDKPIPNDFSGDGNITHYLADIRHSSDYSPFGVTLEGRDFALVGAEGYRYGYQGSEKDDEVKGEGNSYTTYFRQLDPRVGRWLSIDPKMNAWESPYVSMANNPLLYNDPLGDKIKYSGTRQEKRDLKRMVRQAKREDSDFKDWYKDRKSESKINYFHMSDHQNVDEGNNFKTLKYTDASLTQVSKNGVVKRDFVDINIGGGGSEDFIHAGTNQGSYYFNSLEKKEPQKIGVSIGLRIYNVVLIDIQLNRTARWESYFPGRNGNKKAFDGLYYIPKDSDAGQSYPDGHSHPLFFMGKEWLIPCLHPEAYGRGMRGYSFANELPPDKPPFVIDLTKRVFGRIFKPYIWTP